MDQLGEKLAAALGVSEKMQEIAEPAEPQAQTEQPKEGAKEQEPAEPAGNEETGNQVQKEQQSLQERKENAARRRAAERQKDIDAAVQKERERNDAEMAAFFKTAGMKNTFTGEPITTMEEFRFFSDQFKRDSADKALESGKLTRGALNQVIDDNPTMQAMAKFLEAQQDPGQKETEETAEAAEEEAEAAEAPEEAENAQTLTADNQINKELQEIQNLAPQFKGMDLKEIIPAIMKDPKMAPVFNDAVMNQDKNFVEAFQDAYKVAHFDEAVSQQARQAQEAEARKQRGKQHLIPDGNTRGAGAPTIPTKELEMARRFNPGMTDAELQAAYIRDQKRLQRTT